MKAIISINLNRSVALPDPQQGWQTRIQHPLSAAAT
jgi:hypothetical protein